MATLKESYKLEKVTMNLREGDFERLRILHGNKRAAQVVRRLIIGHIRRVEAHVVRRHAGPQTIFPMEEDNDNEE